MTEQRMISVVIPTHNRPDKLLRAVRSVLAQDFRPIEVVVCADGYAESARNALSRIADPLVKLVEHATSQGASAARNTAIRATRGDTIAFLDDDDEWLAGKLTLQAELLSRSGPKVGLVYAWMEYVKDGRVTGFRKPTLRGCVFEQMIDRQALASCSTVMIRREVLDVVGLFDERLFRGNDGDFIRRITRRFDADYVPRVLVRQHVGHGDRISINNEANIRRAIFNFEDRFVKFADDLPRYPRAHAGLHLQLARHRLWLHEFGAAARHARAAIRVAPGAPAKAQMLFGVARSLLSPRTWLGQH